MIRAFTTGTVRIRQSQIVSERQGGALELLRDKRWSDWLPITAWLIEHEEGLILVDTGETARTMTDGYFPRWHPYYRRAVEFDVQPEDEIGPQLRAAGYRPEDIRHVILTHLHTDHAGGLHHFPHSTIWIDKREYESAQGFGGKLAGYLPHRWPDWFAPNFYAFEDRPYGPFNRSAPFLDAITILPTPGHSVGHISVAVEIGNRTVVLAGDASYTEAAMQHNQGGAAFADVGFESLARLKRLVAEKDCLYLPTHEIGVGARLGELTGAVDEKTERVVTA